MSHSDNAVAIGDELYEALTSCMPVAPLTDRFPALTVEDAYRIQLHLIERRLKAGERVVGKKIGLTSLAVQAALGVSQPDFGHLTSNMAYVSGDVIDTSKLIAPRAEGEIAFILKRDLAGPGVTNQDVLAATECVLPCFEIVDSRVRDWKIKIEDTVADNASSGAYVLGHTAVDPYQMDFVNVRHGGREKWRSGRHRCGRCGVGVAGHCRGLVGQHPGAAGHWPESR